MAWARLHLAQRVEAEPCLLGLRCRAALPGARDPRRGSQGLPVRRGAEGRHQALGVQGLRHGLHARAPDRHVHGLLRGRLRRVLQLRPFLAWRETASGGVMATREQAVLDKLELWRRKPTKFRDERITMAHGAGGKATQALVEGLLAPAFGMTELADAGAVDGLALTTDAFVVKPIRFPGGSIGELAVNGTVNDLAVAGARPLALSLSLILEEGLGAGVLTAEVEAIATAAREAGVDVVAGD